MAFRRPEHRNAGVAFVRALGTLFRPWLRNFGTTTRTRNRARGALSYVRSVRSHNIQFSEALEECLVDAE